jgi:hypothetical protein
MDRFQTSDSLNPSVGKRAALLRCSAAQANSQCKASETDVRQSSRTRTLLRSGFKLAAQHAAECGC